MAKIREEKPSGLIESLSGMADLACTINHLIGLVAAMREGLEEERKATSCLRIEMAAAMGKFGAMNALLQCLIATHHDRGALSAHWALGVAQMAPTLHGAGNSDLLQMVWREAAAGTIELYSAEIDGAPASIQ